MFEMDKTEKLIQNSTEHKTPMQNNISEDMTLFYSIFENAPLLMMVVNQEVKIENINHAASEALGVQKEHSLGLLGGEIFSCVNSFEDGGCGKNPNCKDCIIRNTVTHTFQTSRSVYKKECEFTIRVDNQSLGRHLIISTTFINTDNQPKVLLTVDDVTDQKKIEQMLKESKQNLFNEKNAAEAANKAKSEFLAKMSHELRTPLNSVIGFSDLLLTESYGELSEKQARFVKNIMSSGKHLLDLTNDVLDISKIEAGKMELHLECFTVPETISEVTEIISLLSTQKDIDLEIIISKEVDVLYADKSMFKQILYNLISNAIKFTPFNGKVCLKADIINDNLSVSVIDNGIGISSENQKLLFEPFQQIDSSLSREYKGTGLGLVVVKGFVQMHDGNINLQSEIGEGSTFTFTLPLNRQKNKSFIDSKKI
jgi:signal transduction histidine kinase